MLHLALSGGSFVDPEDREVARRIEVELQEAVASTSRDALLKEPGVRAERDQLILEWHG